MIVGEVLTHLEDRVFEPSLDVASTLRAVGGRGTSVSKRFRAAMGLPISQYILERRYEAPCILVRRTQLDFALIAKAIGLGSGTTFSKFYKKWAGRLPSEDRGRDDE